MSGRILDPQPQTRAAQARAADPAQSAWVSANAGSGKTTVLVRRVLRLLLEGVEPSKILCLTFTEAAAANMKNRLFAELRHWSALDEAGLAARLNEMSPTLATRGRLTRARTLFATALETPGGLKIDTIHAFCTRVLHSAPFEANVPARFEVVQGAEADALIDEAIHGALTAAATHAQGELGQALQRVAQDVEETRFAAVIRQTLANRALFLDEEGELLPLARIHARIAASLALEEGASEAAIARGFFARHLPASLSAALEALLSTGKKTDLDRAALLAAARLAPDPLSAFAALDPLFWDSKGALRTSFMTKDLREAEPAMEQALVEAAEAYGEAAETLARIATQTRSQALATVAHAVLRRYDLAKARARRLDFDDIILRTRALLNRVSATWVLYKLDAGIDHLLVDEAQDTSAAQWDILRRLTDEFFTGDVARQSRLRRTVFAVGDEKQSIYSFQKADPASFDAMRRHFSRDIARVRQEGHRFDSVPLTASFRSTEEIMAGVDRVFSMPAHHRGLVFGESISPQGHETARRGGVGAIDLWPLEANDPAMERKAWEEPVDAPSSGVEKLAARIARVLQLWTEAGQDDLGRPFAPGDVLILLRRRNGLFQAIVRHLKQSGVPVAGMDRLDVGSHIAVEDLLVIARSALLPADDLSLATALKTPLFALDDEALIDLAPQRAGALRVAIAERAGEPRWGAVHQRLGELETRAQRHGPFAFFARLLGPEGGRRAMLARLGAEAGDALDAFLTTAMEYERQHGPSLQGFVTDMGAGKRELKRDLAEAAGEVRVMTVHGAKGLEAPVVILPDLGEIQRQSGQMTLFELPALEAGGTRAAPVWVPRKEMHCAPTLAAKAAHEAAQDDERRRLFYVALTRAEDRLILCGANKEGVAPPESWFGMAAATLAPDLREEPAPDGEGVIARFRLADARAETGADAPAGPAPAATRLEAADLPHWALAATAPASSPSAPLRPSQLGVGLTGKEDASGTEPSAPRQIGRLAHLLLQHLPRVQPEAWARVGEALAAREGAGLPPEQLARTLEVCLALLADPAHALLFGPQTLAEVPVSGEVTLPDGSVHAVTGRIDRLAVTADAVWIVDYKTTARAPRDAAAIRPETLAQLALYQALLARIYPRRDIRPVAIYTHSGAVLEPSPTQLQAALALVLAPSNALTPA